MADQGKTEQATQRRVKKAREEGQFPSAREFVSALQFCVFLGLLGAGGAAWFTGFRQTARSLFSLPFTMRDLHPEDVTHLAWQIFLWHLAPAAGGWAGGGGGDACVSPGNHQIRLEPEEALARFLPPQPARQIEAAAQPEPARAGAGRHHAALLSVGRLRGGARQDRIVSRASVPKRGERLRRLEYVGDDAVLESGGRFHRGRRGGSLPPTEALQRRPAHEQAGHQGRIQGDRRQPADEGPDAAHPARPRAQADDEGGAARPPRWS